MKLVPKHSALMLLVINSEGKGTPCLVVQENIRGACGGWETERPLQNAQINAHWKYNLLLRTVENPGTGEQGMIASREDRCQNHRIHERCGHG